ncbi:MAG: MBL fold metallo-hydrolase [Candidatus Aminicenantes bacterium]|jgi:glyoxylase-like metal-dependent hydrolase (beta-lactamase superfamily II)/Tfp pilus assembly protein PilF
MIPYKKANFLFICVSVLLFTLYTFPQDKSDESLEEAMKHLKSSNSLYLKGVEKFEEGDREDASEAFMKCIKEMPRHAYAHYYLANLFYIARDFSSSQVHMERALANIDFMQELSAFADEQKSSKFNALRGSLEEMWDSTNSCRDSRAIEFAYNQVDKEESDMELAARKRQRIMVRMKAHYLYFYGNVLLNLRRYNDALQHYQEAIRLNPQHADAYNNIIAILYMAKEYSKAIRFWDEAEKHGLDEQLNLKLKVSLYEALDRPAEGILEEDLTIEDTEGLSVMRFCLDFRKDGAMSPPLYENCYIVFNQESSNAVIIDPGVKDPRIEGFIRQRGLKIKAILNTHDHADHTSANSLYAQQYAAPVCAPKYDAKYYDSTPDRLLEDGDILDYEGISVRVIHTPGHTEGSLCFLVGDYIFSGDTLFKNDIGKVWAADENKTDEVRKKMLLAIREKLLALPGKTIVCPGHGKTTTIAAEIAHNPYFAD